MNVCFAAVLSAIGVLASSCVDSSVPEPLTPVAYCQGLAALDCKRYWTCVDPSAREAERAALLAKGIDIGTDEQSCTANVQATCPQKPFTCGVDENYQEVKASVCLDNLERVSCAAWLAEEAAPKACKNVCTSTVTNPLDP